MAKGKQTYYLQYGRQDAFRRTIDIGTDKTPKKVQMVFEPGVPYELSEKEAELLKTEIDVGMLQLANLDPKGRHREPKPMTVDAEVKIASLEKKIEDQAAELRDLKDKLADAEESLANAEAGGSDEDE